MRSQTVGSVVTMIVASCYSQVARVTARLFQLLRLSGCTEERAQLLAIGTAELVNNIIEHAHQNEAGHDILIEVATRPGELRLRVVDHGRPVPEGLIEQICAPIVDPLQVQSLPEGGMGLYIAQQLFDTLDWRHQGSCNVLRATAHY